MLLSFLMVVTYHILLKYTAEWAFAPALVIGYWIFRSRVHLGVKFMKVVYLDKQESLQAGFTKSRVAVVVIASVLLLLPVWPQFVKGPFVLEAQDRVPLRATVPGTITAVYVQEGEYVKVGASLLQMRNLQLDSYRAAAEQDRVVARARATQASLHYADIATTEQHRLQAEENFRVLSRKVAQLSVTSPIFGVVVTPHTADLVGTSAEAGDPLLEIVDPTQLRARIFMPEFAMRDVRLRSPVRLQVKGRYDLLNGRLSSVSESAVLAPIGLVPREQLEGINPPHYYTGIVQLANDGSLRDGMIGTAKIFVRKESVATMTWRFTRDLFDRKVW
jgi:multidrug efflux pump subunit AcrA (membrane-fusion protein)